jgi:hypothetical protein
MFFPRVSSKADDLFNWRCRNVNHSRSEMKTTTKMKKIKVRRAGDVRLTSACPSYQAGTNAM